MTTVNMAAQGSGHMTTVNMAALSEVRAVVGTDLCCISQRSQEENMQLIMSRNTDCLPQNNNRTNPEPDRDETSPPQSSPGAALRDDYNFKSG